MRITKKQLRRIVAEEKARLQEMKMQNEAEIFSEDFYYDLLVDHVELYVRQDGGPPGLTRTEQEMMKGALLGALRSIVEDFAL